MLISLSNVSKIVPKWSLFYFQHILVAIFVTIARVKVRLIPYFYTWTIVLINQYEKRGEKQLLFLGSCIIEFF